MALVVFTIAPESLTITLLSLCCEVLLEIMFLLNKVYTFLYILCVICLLFVYYFVVLLVFSYS